MDLHGLLTGFQVAFSLQGLLFVFIGVVVGTFIGMMPGLGPIAAISVMIPITYGMNPAIALLLMAGVYYGSAYGGASASILLNAPGTSEAVATTFDGYPMAQQGRAGKALAIAALSSFVGGTVGVILMTFFAPLLARVAVVFGPAEYFALMLLGLTAITSLTDGSTIKALISATLGFIFATVGIDGQTGTARFTFGDAHLLEGFQFLTIALGIFALAEVTSLIFKRKEKLRAGNIGSLRLTKKDFKEIWGTQGRQSILGFLIGVLPGAGGSISTLISYTMEKKMAKHPEKFGKGEPKGVAAPETSNNAANTGAFIPLLSLGIPGSGTTAVMLGALIVLGIQPGPTMVTDHPDVFWGVIASMYIGNIMLLIINLPFIPYVAKVLRIPRPMLISLIIVFCMTGVYATKFTSFALFALIGFGVFGYLMRRLHFPAGPFILAFVLGGMMEQDLRKALTISNGSLKIFLDSPIALVIIIAAFLAFLIPILQNVIGKKKQNQGISV
ncbi:MAG TPA: tripartite tricarboxylate transporter permease [Bacillales bacterium]|nr:tripartite tricarboxylate transporter permease [Bacillales bacterium]